MSTKAIKEYIESLSPEERETLQQTSGEDGEAVREKDPYEEWNKLFFGTGFMVDKFARLCRMKEDKASKKSSIVIMANFAARIQKEIIKDDGQDSKMLFEIGGILFGGKILPVIVIPSNKFASMAWPVEHWGAAANIIPGVAAKDNLRYAIQITGFNCSKETIYTHTGWRKIGGKWIYLHGGGAIGADNVIVDLKEANLNTYTLPVVPITDEERRMAAAVTLECLGLGPEEITWPLMASIFLAPLCEPMRQAGYEPSFIIWLSGMTGARKSTVAGLFLSHYGQFTSKALPGSFKDTDNTLERKAFLLKDTVFCVDDYHPVGSPQEKRRMEKIAHSLIRGFADRVGRGRMNSDTSLRETYIPRGLCIVTGEEVPNLGQSATARLLTLELKKDAINLDRLTDLQYKVDFLANCMAGFIDWLRPQIATITADVKAVFPKYRRDAATSAIHGRIPETTASLYMGFKYLTAYFAHIGAITQEDRYIMLTKFWDILMRLSERQGRMIYEDAPTEKFLSALKELIAAHEVIIYNLAAENMAVTPWDGRASSDNFIGWKDNLYYYLLPGLTYRIVSQFYQQQGSIFPIGENTLWKHLDAAGMIYTVQEGNQTRRTHNKHIPGSGKSEKVLWLKVEALKNVEL